MLEFLKNNVGHLIPILVCAGLGVIIMLERFRALFLVYPISATVFFSQIRQLVLENRMGEALAICERYRNKPLARLMKEALQRGHQPQEIIENGLAMSVSEQIDLIKARTGYLSMLANVSTLLGLIGTILGLIQSFEAVGGASAQQRSALLAAGISVAMNHTLWGLSVAVPCMVAYSFLMNRTNRLKSEMERGAVKIIDLFQQRDVISVEHDYSRRGGSSGTHGRRSA